MLNLFKKIALISCIIVGVSANAQELTSKKGFPILPEAKDWSISFDAVPFLDYAFDKTRVLSSAPASSADGALDYSVANTLVGKVMKDANTAYRGKVQFGFGSEKENSFVPKTGSTTGETVTDSKTTSNSDITLGGGMQYYRGKGRLRGYYGYEGLIGFSTGPKETYSYGNALDASSEGSRTTKEKSGMGFNLGARGFVGAEYFFAPKMSVGAEFGWGLGYGMVGEGETTTESFDGTSIKSTTIKTGGESSFGAGIDNAGGSINLSIYF